MMADPFEIFEEDVVHSRGIRHEEIQQRFNAWAAFIVHDLRSFFEQHPIGTTTWTEVRDAMRGDPSCTWSSFGMVFADALRFGATNAR